MSFDYVVVGGGSAGSILATRLSEDPQIQVLLIEAGNAEPLPAMALPEAWPTLMDTTANWRDMSTVQAFTGTSIPLPRGRGLGGSSSIKLGDVRETLRVMRDESWARLDTAMSQETLVQEVTALIVARHPEWSGREWLAMGIGCMCAEHPH